MTTKAPHHKPSVLQLHQDTLSQQQLQPELQLLISVQLDIIALQVQQIASSIPANPDITVP